jgi:hypothetical protein
MPRGFRESPFAILPNSRNWSAIGLTLKERQLETIPKIVSNGEGLFAQLLGSLAEQPKGSLAALNKDLTGYDRMPYIFAANERMDEVC